MNPTRHPNGFYVVPLLELFGFRLRLHYWPAATPDDTPHEHRSWVLSLVFGELVETRWREAHGIRAVYRCGATPGNGAPVAEPCGQGGVELVKRRTRRWLYFVGKRTIHSVECKRRTWTLVLLGRPQQGRRPRAWMHPTA